MAKVKIFFLGLLLILIGPVSSSAGQSGFEHVLNLGIQISDIARDKEGFFWLASSNGLKRYDGVEMKTWRKSAEGLSEDFIRAIHSTDDAIWLLTNTRGLNRYDKNTGQFKQYTFDPGNDNSLKGSGGFALLVDRDGYIWAGTENGVLNRLDPKTETFTHFQHDPKDPASLSPGLIMAIFQDSSGILWVGTEGGGLNRLDPQSRKFRHYRHTPGDSTSISGNRVTAIAEEDPHILWIGTGASGLNRFDKRTEEFTAFKHNNSDPGSISNNNITCIINDPPDHLWVGTIHGGLNRMDKKSGRFIHFLNDPDDPNVLRTKVIQRVYLDKSNILWAFSRPGSILKNDRKSKGFALYRHDAKTPGTISSNTILPVYEDRAGTVWVGTGNGGLNRYNRENDSFTAYKYNPDDPQSLPAQGVFSMVEDGHGNFWVNASDASTSTLSLFDRKTGKFVRHYRPDPGDPHSLVQNRFLLDMFADRFNPDIVWMAVAFKGLEKFDTRKEIFTHYEGDPENPKKLGGNYLSIYQDHKGILWLGGTYGLDRFDPKTEQVTRYRHNPSDPDSLTENSVSSIFEGSSGIIWLGTSGGLDRFDRKTETFAHFTTKQGLPDNNVVGVLEDQNGYVWMATGSGIVKFNPKDNNWKLFTEADGLQGNSFYYFSALRTQNGEMWFGGFKGVNRFDPADIRENPHIPRIVLTSVKQGGEEVFFGRTPPRLKEINLDWRSNYFEFEAAALEYTRPEKNRFKYKLAGIDSDWYKSGTRRFGKYTNLPGGTYKLFVKGSNSDGVWNEEGTTLKVTVASPPWKTWWAYSIYFLTGVILLVGFQRYYRGRLQHQFAIKNLADQRRKVEQELEESEQRYRQLIETMSEGLVSVDAMERIDFVNPRFCRMLGYSDGEILGRSSFDLLDDKSQRILEKQIENRKTGIDERYEIEFRKKDGSSVSTMVSSRGLFDDTGKYLGSLSVITDITERIRTRELMVQSEKMMSLGGLAAGIAHEINNPLAGMVQTAALLTNRLVDTNLAANINAAEEAGSSMHAISRFMEMRSVPSMLENIRQSGKRAGDIVKNMLSFARQSDSVMDRNDMALLMEEALELAGSDYNLKKKFDFKQIEIIRHYQEHLPQVSCESPKILQVLLNILRNGAEAMQEEMLKGKTDKKPTFTLRLAHEGRTNMVRLEIRDNGPGMDEDTRKRIFEPFFTTKPSNHGTGLGLSVSYFIISDDHSGTLDVESQPGNGTAFIIRLPVANGK